MGWEETKLRKLQKKNIQQTFRSTLTEEKNIKEAFNKQISYLQDYCAHSQFIGQKSAALICYIDETTNTVHVGGVGNNQACIIRQYSSGERKIIPLAISNKTFINDQNETLQISYVAFPLKKGDVLILGSSNLFEFISEFQRITIGSKEFTAQQIANSLINQNKKINKKAIVVNFS